MSQSSLYFSQKKIAEIALFLSMTAVLGWLGTQTWGVDFWPLKWAIELELSGESAYGPIMQQRFHAMYGGANLPYPLPAIWLALPIAFVPEYWSRAIWCILSFGSIVAGISLLKLPWPLILFCPLYDGLRNLQPTVLTLV